MITNMNSLVGKIYHLSLLFLIVLFSCENHLNIIDDVDSKPVVYSLLNLSDTVYSVSLTRTFIEETDIYQLAKDPNVLFYPSANIKLAGLEGDSIVWSTTYFKSEVTKEEGIFPSQPGYLYRSNTVISEFDEYGYLGSTFRIIERFKLSIEIPSKSINISTTIPVFRPNYILSPRNEREIDLYASREFEIRISSKSGSSYRQLNFKIRYFEKLHQVDDLSIKEIEYIARKDLQIVDNNIVAPIPVDFFFNKMVANIPIVEDLHYRKFIDFDIILYSADNAFDTYRETYDYTTDAVIPAWSNIENGLGIFCLLFTHKKEGFTLDQRTIDSLAMSPITRKLKFVRWE